MTGTPIEITLYDENDEVKATFTRSIIPWKILKKAVRFSRNVDLDNISEDVIDELAGLIVEAFGDKFTIEDLDEGADVGDMISVIKGIISKATKIINPT